MAGCKESVQTSLVALNRFKLRLCAVEQQVVEHQLVYCDIVMSNKMDFPVKSAGMNLRLDADCIDLFDISSRWRFGSPVNIKDRS